MSKPWGGIKIGDWADEAELAEKEHAAAVTVADAQSFPSLKEAANNAKSKKKKNKMTLSEFYTAPAGKDSVGLTPQEIIQLPTGPRQRSEEEMKPGRLGGGFSSYGGRSSGPPGRMGRDRDASDGSWGGGGGRRPYGGGFDDERRGPSDFAQPSRADEVDNWGKAKRLLPSFDQGRESRYGGGGGGGGFSKADENDNWGAAKRQAPVRSSTFGSNFGDSSRWSREVTGGGGQEERRRLVLEPRKVDPVKNETPLAATNPTKPNPFGAARPREDVLAEKGVDWKKRDSEIEAMKGISRPTSAQSSRPSSAQSNKSETSGLNYEVKPRPKVNPFGDAKPREVLLEERGKDWRKMDFELEHRRVDRPETEEEKMLREEIEELSKKLESIAPVNKESKEEPGINNNHHDLPETIRGKEKDLQNLTRELDDKVRFRQQRPGSGGGRTGSYSGRTHSQSGSIDESRSFESNERPRSRGAVDAWVKNVDEQSRNFQGSKDRGYYNNRPASREGW